MPNKKLDFFMFWIVFLFPIIVFIFTPAYAENESTIGVANYFDKFLFGNGYYKPDSYPFAAKLTNSLSFIFAVIASVSASLFQCRKKYTFNSKNIILGSVIIVGLTVFMIWLSVVHQDFSTTKGISFGTKASFHNNPVLFLFLMVSKTAIIYGGIRYVLAFITTFLIEWKEYRERKRMQ